MIDNFSIISNFMKFDDSGDDFYYLQILKRKKENKELGSNSYLVKTYCVNSKEYLDSIKGEIINLCQFHNARAYIHLNRRSFERSSYHMLKKVTDIVMSKNHMAIKNAFNSVCGKYKGGKDKLWVVDIDDKDIVKKRIIVDFIEDLNPIEFKNLNTGEINSKILLELDTKNGVHLITKPFQMNKFKDKYPEIDVHKNNPTIIYSN